MARDVRIKNEAFELIDIQRSREISYLAPEFQFSLS